MESLGRQGRWPDWLKRFGNCMLEGLISMGEGYASITPFPEPVEAQNDPAYPAYYDISGIEAYLREQPPEQLP